jgi:hypothetical protein
MVNLILDLHQQTLTCKTCGQTFPVRTNTIRDPEGPLLLIERTEREHGKKCRGSRPQLFESTQTVDPWKRAWSEYERSISGVR